jgi:hypothetical protein
MRLLPVLALAAALTASAMAETPAFQKSQALRIAAEEAMVRGDYAAAETALKEALELRPNHPGIILALAAAEAQLGAAIPALTHLEQFAGMGMAANLGADDSFARLMDEPRFAGVLTTIARNLAPVGNPQTVLSLGDGRALFEAIALDTASGRVFASSVRERRIIVVENGVRRDFVAPGSGLWSVYGLAIDARNGLLWAASAAGPLTEGAREAEYGATRVFAFDLATGALKRQAVLPPDGAAAFGDLAVAADGTVYVSDSANAALYRLAPGATALEPFAVDPRWVSPQGLVLAENDTLLVVADYAMGLYTIDVATQKMAALPAPSGTTVVGIDELTGEGRLLMATQNGVTPQRVLRLAIGADWTRIAQVAVMAANVPVHRDIALGQVVNGQFYYIANSQWDRFGEDGALPTDAPFAETLVVKLPVQ